MKCGFWVQQRKPENSRERELKPKITFYTFEWTSLRKDRLTAEPYTLKTIGKILHGVKYKKNDTLQFRIMITKIMERVKIQLWDPGPYHVSAKKRN